MDVCDIKTSLLRGTSLNVTWHLAYPHQGGFRLELMDAQERPVSDLTPVTASSKFLAHDATAQSFRVTLPDQECKDCTIRLLREAKEWGSRYQFWSCANVDIVSRRNYRETCSNNGRYMVSQCRCNPRFYGSRCQYTNECEGNNDCGFYGRCVDLDATTYPKKKCFCTAGRFGHKCSKSSLVSNRRAVSLSAHRKKKLSDDMTLYWRVLRTEGEIEIVIVSNGTSYAAVGWRPQGTTKECKKFPYIKGEVSEAWAKGNTPPEAEPAAEGEPEPEAEGEPEPHAEGEPEPHAEGEPEPEPGAGQSINFPASGRVGVVDGVEPKGEPEPYPEGEPEPHAEGESEPYPEGEPEPHAEGEPEPNAEGEPEPESEPHAEGESEPHAEGEPEPHAEGEPEPNSEPEPEPGQGPSSTSQGGGTRLSLADRLTGLLVPRSKREARPESLSVPLLKPAQLVARETDSANAEPEPEAEAESKAEPEAEAEAEAEPESEPESEPLSGDSPFVPKLDFHAMDCTDIVIGAAQGNLYLIEDYYTRDRSTPRVDEFWGGEGSLTAALGWEEDGVTTILFRRKLEATHPTDHPIKDELTHVIWAKGQEPGRYIHSPSSGLEAGQASSIPDFYRPDEIKYHGKRDQRGVTTINFMEQEAQIKEEVNWCGNHWRYPSSCTPGENCQYYARWEYDEPTDYIKFKVQTTHTQLWTGIGFTDNTRMPLTDAVIGWVEGSGRYFMFDAWARSYSAPVVDPNQGITNFTGYSEDGLVTLEFARRRVSGDSEYDLSFTDEQCLYMVFPIKGGSVKYVAKRIRKHEVTPIISTERICIRSCSKFGGADGRPFVYTTTPRPPQLHYEVEMKLTGVGSNYEIPEPGSTTWIQLTDRVRDSVEAALKDVPGYEATEVVEVVDGGSGTLVAKMEVILDKTAHEAEAGEVPPVSPDDGQEEESMVRQVLEDSMGSGRIGALKVDPQYLRVSRLRGIPSRPPPGFVLPVADGGGGAGSDPGFTPDVRFGQAPPSGGGFGQSPGTFGQPPSGGFGQSPSGGGFSQSPGTFGQPPSGGTFSQPPSGSFGQPPSGGFGQSPSGGGFGQSPSGGGFGQSPSGGGFSQSPGTFGQPPSGGTFSQPPSGSFGQSPGTFSQPPSGGSFGQFPGTFGQPPSGGTFGQPPSGGTFGQPPSGGTFGQPPSGGTFGQPPSGGSFGQPPSGGSFGQPPSGGFGQPPSGGFGQPPSGSFGQLPSGTFGQSPGTFGQPPSGSFDQGQSRDHSQQDGSFSDSPGVVSLPSPPSFTIPEPPTHPEPLPRSRHYPWDGRYSHRSVLVQPNTFYSYLPPVPSGSFLHPHYITHHSHAPSPSPSYSTSHSPSYFTSHSPSRDSNYGRRLKPKTYEEEHVHKGQDDPEGTLIRVPFIPGSVAIEEY
ncbi:hypothetical protein Pcinc_033899 [Petrolisthes cinctipes]|uniref:Uncharacterized protein n=1 Tax=Petrolisthes cinctipes TaxID=88211 RepID=A0AAE1ERH3_PETCI|nr:hypothetical protein Pcinc_033899 [Petrolisthes cinctipes]